MKRFLSILLCGVMLMSCLGGVSFTALAESGSGEFVIDSLEQYVVYTGEIANDGYIGIPVGLKAYKLGDTTTDTPLILYVVNTNTERVGRESDENIITSLLNQGYLVLVLDYYNNPKTVCPDLDWSIQRVKNSIRADGSYTYLGGNPFNITYTYILPAGYSLIRQQPYWSFDQHGANGSLDFIVNVWNNDFTGVHGNVTVTFAKETKILKGAGESEYITFAAGESMTIKEYNARLTGGVVTDISQCIKKDGSPIEMDLMMDIIYPVNPENKVPVMMYAQSGQDTVGTWHTAERPHFTGFLLNGYAGVLYDHAFVPMARNDHYGYFDGNLCEGSLTGDNKTYTVGEFSDMNAGAAAIRKVRYMADAEPEVYKFAEDKYGITGISKSGRVVRHGHPEAQHDIVEMRLYEGHSGETRYDAGKGAVLGPDGETIVRAGEPQPWLTYESTGEEIPSNVQFSHSAVGTGQHVVTDNYAPQYIYATLGDGGSWYGGFYPDMISRAYSHDIPTMDYTCVEVGHSFSYGPDRDTGNDTYQALFDCSNYWLKDEGVKCEWIKPYNGTKYVSATDIITVRFNATVPESEISKITITNNLTNENAEGSWKSSFGGTKWEFTPYNLMGGCTYTVTVPADLKGENGKNVKAAKSSSFTVSGEVTAEAAVVGSDNLNMTADTENGVYFEFDETDFSESYSTAIRFSVTNDAANTVLVYGAESDGEGGYTQGALIGEIILDGAGNYEIDVTSYVNALESGKKAAFMLKTKKEVGEKVVLSINCDDAALPNGALQGAITGAVSSDFDHTTGSGSSIKIADHVLDNTYAPYHSYYEGNVAYLKATVFNPITAADFGRKFNVSFSAYDTTDRIINASIGRPRSGLVLDEKIPNYSFTTKANEWSTHSFDFKLNHTLYTLKNELTIGGEMFGAASAQNPIYLDDITVTEYVTEVAVASEASQLGAAPSLVLHPTNTIENEFYTATYVQSGELADTSFEDSETLKVSGRSNTYNMGDNSKVYAKVSLADYDGASNVRVGINITSGKGDVAIYGLEDTDWTEQSINIINAPVNDRYGYGIDESKVWDNAPITTLSCTKSGTYQVDITDFAKAMYNKGKTEATLILVSKTEYEPVVFAEDFSDGNLSCSWKMQGGPGSAEVSDEENYPDGVAGYSYKDTSLEGYGSGWIKYDFLGKDNLTTADVGRKFLVTYYVKAENAGTFANGLMDVDVSSSSSTQIVTQTYTTPGEWQKFEYPVEITSDLFQSTYSMTGVLIGRFNLENNAVVNQVMYIDNIEVRELGVGDIELEFVNPGADPTVFREDFNDGDIDCSTKMQGGPGTAEVSAEENYPDGEAGYSYKDTSLEGYGSGWIKYDFLGKDSLTTADVGRKFLVTYYVKAENAGTFANGLMDVDVSSSLNTQIVTQTYTTPGEWQKFEYPVEITSDLFQPTYSMTGVLISRFNLNADNTVVNQVMYIDNIVVTEIIEEIDPNVFAEDFNDGDVGCSVIMSGGPGTMGVSDEENYPDGEAGYSYKDTSTEGYGTGRIKFDLIGTDSLTTADEGRKFLVTYYLKAENAGGFSNYLMSMANSNSAKQVVTQTYTTPGEWQKFEYTFELTSDLFQEDGYITGVAVKRFDLNADNTVVNQVMYIDNITVTEIIDDNTSGYCYVQDFESDKLYTGTLTDADNGPQRASDKADYLGRPQGFDLIDAETWYLGFRDNCTSANHTEGGSKSLELLFTKGYNRMLFWDVIDSLTADDLGRTFRTSLWMKADKAGAYRLGFTSFAKAASFPVGKWDIEISADDVGVWKKFTFEYEITQDMIDGGYGMFQLMPDANISEDKLVYIDDLTSIELLPTAGVQLEVTEAKAINPAEADPQTLAVRQGRDDSEIYGVKKAYLKFEDESYGGAQNAMLSFNVDSGSSKVVKVYAIVNSTYPSAPMTYKTALASNADESMNTNLLYGGGAIARLEVNGSGTYSVDVTKYVKAQSKAGAEIIFAIVSEDAGGSECVKYDFESIKVTSGVDYISDADVAIADGAATVSGNKITMLNAFGNGNEAVSAGKTYKISADVTATGNVTIGVADADGNIADSASYTLDGSCQTVTFEYTATAEDAEAGICAITIESATAGFTVDNICAQIESELVITKDAKLVVKMPTEPVAEAKYVNIGIYALGNGSIELDGTDIGSSVVKNVASGEVLSLNASGEGRFIYWIDKDAGTILSYEESYLLTAGSDRNIAAVYAGESDIFVTFTSLGNKLVASGVSGSITTPANPYVYGYSFHGWYANGEKAELTADDVVTAEENTEYKAGFVKDDTTYTVTVNGVGETHTYNEKVTVTADAEKDGAAFSYWKRDGEIVSYNTSYSFYVNGDTVVEAIYGESAESEIVLAMAAPVLVDGTKIAFFAERDIPAAYQLIETGILIGTAKDLTVDNAQYKATAKSTLNKGQYTVRKANVSSGETWYAAAYAIYRDASGNVLTAYSNEVSYPVE